MALKMSRKRSGVVIYSHLKDNAVTAVKRNNILLVRLTNSTLQKFSQLKSRI